MSVLLFDPLERVLWIIAISILLIGSCLFFYRAREKEAKPDRLMSFAFSISYFLIALTKITAFITVYYIPGEYILHSYYSEYHIADAFTGSISGLIPVELEFLIRLQLIFPTLGFFSFSLIVENITQKTKYILSMLQVAGLITIIILPINLALNFNTIYTMLNFLLYLIVLTYFTKKAPTLSKGVASFFFFGYLLVGSGAMLSDIKGVPIIISPIFFIIGAIFPLIPLIVRPDRLAQGFKYTASLGGVIIGIAIILIIIVYIYSAQAVILFIWPLFAVVEIIVLVQIIKLSRINTKEEELKSSRVSTILGSFKRPQKLTEEEVSIAKEKKICLVCKNKLTRKIYLCPECSALYCMKCSEALADSENACWACDAPFDESKPIQKLEASNSKIQLDEEHVKLNKKT